MSKRHSAFRAMKIHGIAAVAFFGPKLSNVVSKRGHVTFFKGKLVDSTVDSVLAATDGVEKRSIFLIQNVRSCENSLFFVTKEASWNGRAM